MNCNLCETQMAALFTSVYCPACDGDEEKALEVITNKLAQDSSYVIPEWAKIEFEKKIKSPIEEDWVGWVCEEVQGMTIINARAVLKVGLPNANADIFPYRAEVIPLEFSMPKFTDVVQTEYSFDLPRQKPFTPRELIFCDEDKD